MPATSTLAIAAQSELAAVGVLPPEQHPVAVYLASLASEHSRRAMRGALDRIAQLVGATDARALDWSGWRYQHSQAIRSTLMDAGYAPSSVQLHLSALRGVLREAWRLGQLNAEDYHRATDVKAPKASRLPAGRHVDMGELGALFDTVAADGEPAGAARDAALLAVLLGGGLRRSEAVALDVDDFDAATGALRIRGKGDRERIAYLTNGAARAVADWLAHRGEAPGSLLCPVSKSGKLTVRRMSTAAAAYALQRIARRAGVSQLSPHDARRSFIGELLEAGADLVHVQQLVGHASPTTTSRYDRRPEEARRKAAERLHVPYRPRSSS